MRSLLSIILLSLLSCGGDFTDDAEKQHLLFMRCASTCCRAAWGPEEEYVERMLLCTLEECVCHRDMALSTCRGLEEVSEGEMEAVLKEGCCK